MHSSILRISQIRTDKICLKYNIIPWFSTKVHGFIPGILQMSTASFHLFFEYAQIHSVYSVKSQK
jgi:hypothetical protein